MEFINLIKGHKNAKECYDAHRILNKIYRNGNCYMFAKALQFVFPQAVLYNQYEFGYHIVACCNGVFYDITGMLKDQDLINYSILTETQEEWARTWCYSEYHDRAYGLHDHEHNRIDSLKGLKLKPSNDGWDVDSKEVREEVKEIEYT
jgi:hypothetical protein